MNDQPLTADQCADIAFRQRVIGNYDSAEFYTELAKATREHEQDQETRQ